MRAEGDVHHAIHEGQPRPVQLPQWVEGEGGAIAPVAGARHCGRDGHRPGEFFCPGGDVERMKALDIGGSIGRALLGLGHDIQRVGGWIDDRRSGHADHGNQIRAGGVQIRNGNCGPSFDEQAGLPERRPGGVGVKRVHGVILGRHIDDVMDPLVRDRDIRHVERLRIDLLIDRIGE